MSNAVTRMTSDEPRTTTSEGRDHFVYRLFDSAERLLYVGCTRRLDKRWAEHKHERPGMVAVVTSCKLQGPYTRKKARSIELEALRSEHPLIGWTPARHRRSCERSRLVKRRAFEIAGDSNDLPVVLAAFSKAADEVDKVLPDPFTHARDYVPVETVRSMEMAGVGE